jgi:phosphatidylserine decarboxylase
MKIKKRHLIILFLAIVAVLAFYPSPEISPNKYVDRKSGEIITEKVAGEKWLVWLYNNPLGKATMFTLVKRKFVSEFYGNMMDSPKSVEKIDAFVKDLNIDLSIAEKQNFDSFNDFFIRKLKKTARIVDTSNSVICSPADGKILAYSNIKNANFIVKGVRFNVESFLQNDDLARKYNNGSLIIVRLAPYDYHRFHFPLSGKITLQQKINGDLYSVNPIALREMAEIFWINKREYVSISNQIFGNVIMCEVGATMVGSIIQNYQGKNITKGQEKGYFKFGGSTVVLLFEKNKINIDNDLLENTKKGLETEVKYGEKIGSRF